MFSRNAHLLELAFLTAFAGATALLAPTFGATKAFLVMFAFLSLIYSLTVSTILGSANATELPKLAARHDERAAFVLVIAIAVILAALMIVLVELENGVKKPEGALLVGGSVIGAWVLLNTIFAIHYAHCYFANIENTANELIFPGERPGVFTDFLYFAFVIGMTFQVSDVAVGGAHLRRFVLAHSVLSFFLNVFVLALMVNALGSFI